MAKTEKIEKIQELLNELESEITMSEDEQAYRIESYQQLIGKIRQALDEAVAGDVFSGEIIWRQYPSFNRVLGERMRQVNEEGYTIEHDDSHGQGQLARASACYVLPEPVRLNKIMNTPLVKFLWPWSFSQWKPTPLRIRELEKGLALGHAEMDRLIRLENDIDEKMEDHRKSRGL